MRELSILISACNSPSMPGLVNCFHNNGERKIRVVGSDMSNEPEEWDGISGSAPTIDTGFKMRTATTVTGILKGFK